MKPIYEIEEFDFGIQLHKMYKTIEDSLMALDGHCENKGIGNQGSVCNEAGDDMNEEEKSYLMRKSETQVLSQWKGAR